MPCMIAGASDGMAPAWFETRSAPPTSGIFSIPSHSTRNQYRYIGSYRRRVRARACSERPHSSTSLRRCAASGSSAASRGTGTRAPGRSWVILSPVATGRLYKRLEVFDPGGTVIRHSVARVEHVARVGGHEVEVEGVVVDEEEHRVGGRDLVRGGLHPYDASVDVVVAGVRVGRPDVGSEVEQALRHDEGRRLAGVAGVALVGEPEQQYPAATECPLFAVERHHHATHDIVGHVVVDVVGQLDEAERLAQAAAHPPRQVARVDRQAVAPRTGPGSEPEEAERLGRRRLDRLPHVDAEVGGEHGQLVDDGDVEPGARGRIGARPVPAGAEHGRELLRRYVLHVGLARRQPLHPALVDVVAHDLVPDLGRPHGDGQPHVALPDDHDLHADNPRTPPPSTSAPLDLFTLVHTCRDCSGEKSRDGRGGRPCPTPSAGWRRWRRRRRSGSAPRPAWPRPRRVPPAWWCPASGARRASPVPTAPSGAGPTVAPSWPCGCAGGRSRPWPTTSSRVSSPSTGWPATTPTAAAGACGACSSRRAPGRRKRPSTRAPRPTCPASRPAWPARRRRGGRRRVGRSGPRGRTAGGRRG